jgi:ABC-type transport system involved in multi-copper enzyme maturation permease subunit
MLWLKVWRESRDRFLLMALCVIGYFVMFVMMRGWLRLLQHIHLSYTQIVYEQIYASRPALYFFLLVPTLLAMGGLLRERARGTALLSLSLPVSRLRLTSIRAVVGLLQLALLALVPVIVIPSLSPLVGVSYPFSLALHFGLLWFACCSAVFAMSFLLSVMLDGEYTALAAALAATVAYESITDLPSLQPGILRFNLLVIMSGRNNLLPGVTPTTTIPDPFPWIRLFAIGIVTCILLTVAARITQRQDF